MEILSALTVGVLVVFAMLSTWLAWLTSYSRGKQKIRAVWEKGIDARLLGHDKQLETVTHALAALAPHDARPTAAHHPRARLAPPPAAAPASGPAAAPASGPAAAPGPRMRVETKPTGFASDRLAVVFTSAEDGQTLTLDARDVNEREGTMHVQVLDATTRADAVLVAFPAERVPRGPRVWVPRALVLDLGAAPPLGPPPAPVDIEGDRSAEPGSISPGRATATDAPPRFAGKPRIKITILSGAYQGMHYASFMMGEIHYLFAHESTVDAAEGTTLVNVIPSDGPYVELPLPNRIIGGPRRLQMPPEMVIDYPPPGGGGAPGGGESPDDGTDDEPTQALDRDEASKALCGALAKIEPVRPPSSARRTVADLIARNAPAVALNTRTAHRIDVLFWSKLTLATKSGVQTAHCNGPECDGDQTVCVCSCAPCDRRRTLRESATIEITGPQTAAELAERARAQDPTILQRIQRLWHEKIAAAQEAGKDARHCHGARCMEQGEGIALCDCKCDGCALIVDLLVAAQQEIAG